MKLSEFKTHLLRNPESTLNFMLPDGSGVPVHAHVTEVARIDKRFVDCGGTFRVQTFCRLQVWVANDTDHRLTAGKLAGILDKASSFLGEEDHEVDVEHEDRLITQYPVDSIGNRDGCLTIRLALRHTDCLAKDECIPPLQRAETISFKSLKPRT